MITPAAPLTSRGRMPAPPSPGGADRPRRRRFLAGLPARRLGRMSLSPPGGDPSQAPGAARSRSGSPADQVHADLGARRIVAS